MAELSDLTKTDDTVVIYTDGGCDPNPGVGAWAAVLIRGDLRKELSGGESESTNNRMELTAAIRAIEALTRPCRVVLHTDSEYLRKGITVWMHAWKRNNWRRKRGEVKNIELWKRLDELVQVHEIDWAWVPGHSGIVENERCDEMVGEEIKRQKGSIPD